MTHPSIEEWIEYASGQLGAERRAALERHLEEGCESCLAKQRELSRFFGAIASDRLLAPSAAAQEAALRAFRPVHETATRPSWARSLTELGARVVFDSAEHSGLAFAGARGTGTTRRLRFEAGTLELDALVEAEGDRRRLTAQVLELSAEPHPVAGARFLLAAGGNVEAEGETDTQGELVGELSGPGEIEIRVAEGGRLAIFRIPDRASPRVDD